MDGHLLAFLDSKTGTFLHDLNFESFRSYCSLDSRVEIVRNHASEYFISCLMAVPVTLSGFFSFFEGPVGLVYLTGSLKRELLNAGLKVAI